MENFANTPYSLKSVLSLTYLNLLIYHNLERISRKLKLLEINKETILLLKSRKNLDFLRLAGQSYCILKKYFKHRFRVSMISHFEASGSLIKIYWVSLELKKWSKFALNTCHSPTSPSSETSFYLKYIHLIHHFFSKNMFL